MFTLLEGLELLIGQPQLLLLVLQGAVLPAELHLLQGLDFELLLQLHHFVHQEVGQTLVTLLHCREEADSRFRVKYFLYMHHLLYIGLQCFLF